MKVFKRTAWILVMTLTFILLPINTNKKVVNGQGSNNSNLDVVFVMDASKSMAANDPEGLRIEALKLFIDMCKVKGDKMGLVAYGGGIVKVDNLKEIYSPGDKELIKRNYSQIPQSQSTDIGLALMQAIDVMKKGIDKNNKPIIILVSDGRNDPERPKEQSDSDMISAIKAAREMDCKIYSIGLNASGNVDKGLMDKISMDTNGKSFVINSANDITGVFSQIFADGSQLKLVQAGTFNCNGGFQNIELNIPSSNVTEANIAITSQSKVDLKLTDNKGNVVYIPSDKIFYSYSNRYALLKILKPAKGKWTLSIKGAAGNVASLSLIFNYDIHISAEYAPEVNIKTGTVIKVKAYMESSFNRINDNELYKQLNGKLIVKNSKTEKVEEIPLTNKGTYFEGDYKIPSEDNYEFKIRIDGNSLYRESEIKRIGMNNTVPEIKNKIDILEIKTNESKIILLSEYFSNSGSSILTFDAIANPPGIASIKIIGDRLTIEGKKSGSALLTLTAKDVNGGSISFDTNLKVTNRLPIMYIIIGAAGVLVLVIIIFLLIKSSKSLRRRSKREARLSEGKDNSSVPKDRKFEGQLMVSIKDDSSGYLLPPLVSRLENYKRVVTVSQLVSGLSQYKEMNKIRILPGQENSIIILNESNCAMKKNSLEINSKRRCIVKDEDKVDILLLSANKTISLQYFASDDSETNTTTEEE